jgi:hypothetical protein
MVTVDHACTPQWAFAIPLAAKYPTHVVIAVESNDKGLGRDWHPTQILS